MARMMSFGFVILAMLVLGFSLRGGRQPASPGPIPNAVMSINGVPVRPGDIRMQRALRSATDARAASFLRQALVMAEALRADEGKYSNDRRRFTRERPANVVLNVIRVGDEGIRMTAIDNSTQRQCDIFAGDSAHWAFGYAYDPRVPACGKAR